MLLVTEVSLDPAHLLVFSRFHAIGTGQFPSLAGPGIPTEGNGGTDQ
jgi:hypothetical protein